MAADVETVIPQIWTDALTYAVKKNKGILKVSSYKNHISPKCGHPYMENEQIHALYAAMIRDGYLEEIGKQGVGRGGVRMWQVTDKGREAVQ